MSLLLLLRPLDTGSVVTPPDTSTPLPIPGQSGPPIKPAQVFRFPAGRARILIRAEQPSLLILPTPERARVRIRAARSEYALELTSNIKKQQRIYRAVRDERVDEEFHDLVKTAFFLSR